MVQERSSRGPEGPTPPKVAPEGACSRLEEAQVRRTAQSFRGSGGPAEGSSADRPHDNRQGGGVFRGACPSHTVLSSEGGVKNEHRLNETVLY